MGLAEDWGGLSRAPRGNGVNVHLKHGTTVFVQASYHEVESEWVDARRSVVGRGAVMTFTGKDGKRVTIAPEDVERLEEL